jgi:hypothetical protein
MLLPISHCQNIITLLAPGVDVITLINVRLREKNSGKNGLAYFNDKETGASPSGVTFDSQH